MSQFSPLRSNRSARSRENPKDYWGEAFRRLDWKQQECIKRALRKEQETHRGNESDDSDDAKETRPRVRDRFIVTDGSTSWPDILSEICRQQQEDHKKKSWKCRFAGHDLNLQTTLENWVNFFNKIKQIGDVAVNVDPLHAGLPWAAIRLVITVRNSKQDLPSLLSDVNV